MESSTEGRSSSSSWNEAAAMPRPRGAGRAAVASATVAAALCAVLSGCGGDDTPVATGPSVEALTATCATLKGQTIAGVSVTDAKRIEANGTIVPAGLCQVSGTRAPYLDIEVDIPDNWSGRVFHQGGGGFDGSIPSAVSVAASGAVSAVSVAITQKGAIYAASNGGNRRAVPAQAAPPVWGNGTADGQTSGDDYSYGALGTTITFAKALAQKFYSVAPKFTYFNGCSEGGREAYEVAQRWPDEYDGIVQGCETMDMTALVVGLLNVSSKGGTPAGPSPAQYAAAYASAVAACDAGDGLVDGYLANPASCSLDPATLQCGLPGANPDPTLCLTAAQAATLKSALSDVVLSTGAVAYSKYNWTNFNGLSAPGGGGLAGGFALLATNDPSWLTPARQAAFNLNSDFYLIGNGLQRRGTDHDKQAIASYVASGKKLLTWNDAGDPLVSVNDHARNHATMVQLASKLGLADPRTNTRFFVVPGSTHGAGGNLNEVDWLSAIIAWVENATPPDQLTYAFTVGTTQRNLPVCEFPKYPRYNGSGDVNAAASFTCT
jgi:feruloyl esterase